MPTRYLDPRIDIAFKRVFGEHAHLLRSLLNALLPLPEDGQIESLEYLTPKQVPDLPGLFKNSILDLQCKDLQGRTFIVEVQMLWSTSFRLRIEFSGNEAHVRQKHVLHNYTALQPVYALTLTNDVFDKTTQEYYHHYPTVRHHELRSVWEGLQFVIIELPKFTPQSFTDKKMRVEWLRFLTEIGQTPRKGPGADRFWHEDPDIALALQCVEQNAFSDDEVEIYLSHIDKTRIEATLFEDALAKGKARALAQHHAQGVAAGKVKTIAQMVLAMHAHGIHANQIAQMTGLSAQLISEILSVDSAR
jgi:predicted transposase/invertase (TIGR01784 family)